MVLSRNTIFISFFLLLASCSSSGDSSETSKYQGEQTEQVSAENLYLLHCETCHGVDGTQGTGGAANLQTSKLEDAKIKETILNGNDLGMMPFRGIITDDQQVNDLVEYVKSLRK